MATKTPEEILNEITVAEQRAKRRSLLFVFVPVAFAVALLAYISQHILKAQDELNTIKKETAATNLQNNLLVQKNDSLSRQLSDNVILFGEALSVIVEYKKFIDNIKPTNRTAAQAAFYINMRMYEDKIRGNYNDLCKEVSKLPKLDENRNWIVIIQTSASLYDLKTEPHVQVLTDSFGKEQVAIYEKANKSYILCLKGNGTFTRAYRLTAQLSYQYGYLGSYFADSTDWGTNFLER